jgi:hypothetical protein
MRYLLNPKGGLFMKRHFFRKITALFLCVMFLMPYNIHVHASERIIQHDTVLERSIIQHERNREAIFELLNERNDILFSEKSNNLFSGYSHSNISILSTENKLRSLGVSEMTSQQVAEKFGQQIEANQLIAPLSAGSGNTVYTYRGLFNYNGKVYELQEIFFVPNANSQNSILLHMGNKTVTDRTNRAAGITNFFRASGVIASNVFGTKISVGISIFDALASQISGLSRETIVSSNSILYSWSIRTTALFVFVKPNGTTDSNQRLSHVIYRGSGEIGCQFPWFATINNQPRNSVAQFRDVVTLQTNGDTSVTAGMNAYLRGDFVYCPVTDVKLDGLANQKVSDIRFNQPFTIYALY